MIRCLTAILSLVFCACTGPAGPQGPAGEPGVDGKDGSDGDDGSDAEATRIIESFFCAATLQNAPIAFSYNAVLLSSGDLLVSASVSDSERQASQTTFYAPSQLGYEKAAIAVALDWDGNVDGGFFTLELERTSLVTKINYYANSAGTLAKTWTLQPAACVHNFY